MTKSNETDLTDITLEELATLSVDDLRILALAASVHDPADDDDRFDGLPYDDVLDEFGDSIV